MLGRGPHRGGLFDPTSAVRRLGAPLTYRQIVQTGVALLGATLVLPLNLVSKRRVKLLYLGAKKYRKKVVKIAKKVLTNAPGYGIIAKLSARDASA